MITRFKDMMLSWQLVNIDQFKSYKLMEIIFPLILIFLLLVLYILLPLLLFFLPCFLLSILLPLLHEFPSFLLSILLLFHLILFTPPPSLSLFFLSLTYFHFYGHKFDQQLFFYFQSYHPLIIIFVVIFPSFLHGGVQHTNPLSIFQRLIRVIRDRSRVWYAAAMIKRVA